MTDEQLGRLGVACVVAVLGALLEAQIELCPELGVAASGSGSMAREAIFWWLLMIVGCGVVLDAQQGSSRRRSSRLRLVIAPLIVASVFLGVAAFMAALDRSQQFCFSGLSKGHPALVPLMIAIWFVTGLGAFLLSFSRPPLERLIGAIIDDETPTKIASIEKTIRAAITAIVALALLVGIVL